MVRPAADQKIGHHIAPAHGQEHRSENPDNIKEILKQHHAIYECLRAHDPDAAFKAMQRHITFVIDFFKSRK